MGHPGGVQEPLLVVHRRPFARTELELAACKASDFTVVLSLWPFNQFLTAALPYKAEILAISSPVYIDD